MTRIGPYADEAPRFSRRWWFNLGRSVLWVALVTALVWVYADMERTPTKELEATVVLTTGKSPMKTLEANVEAKIRFTVRGDRTAMDKLEEQMGKIGSVITCDVSGRSELGENFLELKPLLEGIASTPKTGLTVEYVTPPIIKYQIIRPRAEVRATVVLTTGNSKDLMFQTGFKPEINVNFILEGNRDLLESFKNDLNKTASAIVYDVSTESPSAGSREVDLAQLLDRMAGVSKAGLAVVSASPAAVKVMLERRITVSDVEVTFDYEGATLIKEPEITPAKMAIRVGESQWAQIRQKLQPNLKPVIRTTRTDLKNVILEGPTTMKVEVVPAIAGMAVEPEHTSVSVTFQISQKIATRNITVSVRVLWPSDDLTWKEYELKRKEPLEWRKQIQVTGSRKDLDQLDEKDVEAYVVLREDDKKPVASWLTRPVEIRFPQELQLKLLGEKPTVNFKLEKRGSAAPP